MSGSQSPCYRIVCVAGARPNLMKVAPLMRAFARDSRFEPRLIHTGQHYDPAMHDVFFADLGLAPPEAFLGIGSGSHGAQTGRLMIALEPVLGEMKPDAVVVVGDVNSTLAAALVATKMHIPVAHVEAGLRSFDREMPEEINRVVVDQISDLLFATEEDAVRNLTRDGVDAARVHLVGNVMIDSLLEALPRARPVAETCRARGASAAWLERAADAGHAFATLHRPSNVDDRETLSRLLTTLCRVADVVPVVIAVHPRTQKAIATHGLADLLDHPFLLATEPLTYLETVGIVAGARLVLTDSGGLQEETTGLGVPCITLRETTERPVTVSQGTNIVTGTDAAHIMDTVEETLRSGGKKGILPPLWDGKTAERIAERMAEWLGEGGASRKSRSQ
jgi:UDP-N-acetylglucosamine 2-epimerase (non-hydrolysing)